MITSEQINNWIDMYLTSDNYNNEYYEPAVGRAFLKRDLLEAKVQVDRWDLVTTDWIFHTSKKDLIGKLFPQEVEFNPAAIREVLELIIKHASVAELDSDFSGVIGKILTDDELIAFAEKTNIKKEYHIWGANVHFSDDIEENTGVGVALQTYGDSADELMYNGSGNLGNSIVVFTIEN